LISQQKLLTEEKNKKLEELSQETLKLHFENEDKSQSLEQYINFEKAYKDNINRLNELIFNHEKNNKNYDINLKNLKASLKELFKMNNIDQVDSKIFSKLNEINLFNSHEELVYIIKRYITYLRSFIIEFLKLKEEHNFYIKEKKALETDIVNLKVEKDIYQEHLNEKNLDLIQLEEINNTLKNRITSLEEENTNLKGKSVENDKEMINRLQDEIAFLTESNREKDLTIKSLNDNLNILTENISKLERNNYTLERNCEHLSRYEKYSELLETEKAELQKMIVVIECDKFRD
jgi:chromosome segregation ATPase